MPDLVQIDNFIFKELSVLKKYMNSKELQQDH